MGAIGRALILAAMTALAAGCQHVSPATGVQSPFTFTPEEIALNPKVDPSGRPELAVAMSGGGIRSSLYNFGVLKALYDEGLLQQADLISSVSGGSYLSYWLYTEQAKHAHASFAAPLFDNANFGKRLCEFTGKANFVTYKSMVVNAPRGKKLYERRMKAVFGGADSPPVEFAQLADLVESGRAPYLVVNSTVYGRRYNDLPWTSRYFEMTPLHHGSLDERRRWDDGVARESTVLFGALASGAAVSPLKRWFPRPNDAGQPNAGVYLYDGGETENLGAVSALRRGAKRIIIIDAQFDNKGKDFDALAILAERMNDLGVTVAVPLAPSDAAYGVYPGRASGAGADTRIAYVKMERPQEVMGFIDSATPDQIRQRERAFDRFDASRRFRDGEWNCASVTVGADADADHLIEDLMEFNLGAYVKWADGNTLYRKMISKDHPVTGGFTTHAFPRTATFDQSYYVDQALAYVALGYLTARKGVKRALNDESVGQNVADGATQR